MPNATAVAMFPPAAHIRDQVTDEVKQLEKAAARLPGFVETRLSSFDSSALDWAVSITFSSRKNLDRWLASDERRKLLGEIAERGLELASDTIILVEGERSPPGVAVFTHQVSPHSVGQFIELQRSELATAVAEFPGSRGVALLESGLSRGLWFSIVRFDTPEHLDGWLESPRRTKFLPQLRSLLEEDFGVVANRSAFGGIVRTVGGQPLVSPTWKIVLLVVAVLFPTVVLTVPPLTELGKALGFGPGLIMLCSQIIATSLVTAAWMPLLSRAFAWWIDPIDGKSLHRSLLGLLAIVTIYVCEIVVFLIFPGVTPWAAA
ncbi:MAG: hypothetical protein HQ526_04860 [Actinobacteria bacterium]|nr:hypothetical protein [Actinomycetota bacterium]